jgi:WD40 repeat protein
MTIIGSTCEPARRDDDSPMWSTSAGHRRGVRTAAFGADGRRLVTGGDDGYLCIWDVGLGLEKELAHDDHSTAFCAGFSPDGLTLASGHADFTCLLWDATTWQKRATLKGHASPVMCLAFSPDGATLATGGGELEIRLWDVASGTLKATLPSHNSGVSSVRFGPDGRTLAAGCRCGLVKLWDVVDGNCRATRGQIAPGAWVLSLDFSPDGAALATGGYCDALKVWDVATGLERITSLSQVPSIRDVVFSADGQMVIAAELNGNLQLWRPFTGYTRTVHLGQFNTHCTAFSPGGRLLALVGSDGAVRVWDLMAVAKRPAKTAH